MPWDERLTRLSHILAELYPTDGEARAMIDRAQLPAVYVRFDPAPLGNWSSIIREADKRGAVEALIRAAINDYPERRDLHGLLADQPSVSRRQGTDTRGGRADSKRAHRSSSDTIEDVGLSDTSVHAAHGRPEIAHSSLPWRAGSFYLVTFIVAVAGLTAGTWLLIQAGVPAAGAVGAIVTLVTAAVGALVVIGALQLRSDRDISEAGLLRLADLGLQRLRGGNRSDGGHHG